jgi:hypothetical protein
LEGVIVNSFKNVILLPMALSDKQGVLSVIGISNTFVTTAPKHPNMLTQSIAGDQVLASEPRIDFIKIDIEGHEPFALSGLSETLALHNPLVLCEFNPRCLKSLASVAPEEFASSLFGITNSLEVVEHDGNRTRVTSARDLMNLWEAKNQDAIRSGFLPDGMLHFDLFFQSDVGEKRRVERLARAARRKALEAQCSQKPS